MKASAMLTLDPEGYISTWNAGAEAIHGYRLEEIIGCPLSTLYAPEAIASGEPARDLDAARKQGQFQVEGWRVHRDGSSFGATVLLTVLLDREGQTSGFGHLTRTWTEREQADALLRKLALGTESANRAKSEFLANMSHEVRTPLNAILGMAHLALRSGLTPRQRGYLNKIDSAAQALLSLMNDILDFSKIEVGKLSLERIHFSLGEIIERLLDMVGQKAAEKQIPIGFSIAPDVPGDLIGDPLRLGQVLINLVNNAIKFTDRGGIVVRVVAEQKSAEDILLKFSITDSGIGMTPDQVASIFQSFSQADSSITRKYGGTGLGLAISKQLAELMQGSLFVESQLGMGSTFHFTARFGMVAAPLPARPLRKGVSSKRVLVVDDSESACLSLLAMLQDAGHRASCVFSGEEALSALIRASEEREPFDLVLMDWRLPGKDGFETARSILDHPSLAQFPAIVMISSRDRDEVMSGMEDVILDGFLEKPIGERQLLALIDNIFKWERRFENGIENGIEPGPDRSVETEQVEMEQVETDGVEAGRVQTGDKPSPPPALAQYIQADLKGLRVLLVEDNELNRDLATELLADLGITVAIAVDGREGVDRILTEPFDLVLMDIQMPVMDGLTATRRIREEARLAKLPVIAMTAHALGGDRQRSLDAGMNDHMTKPISFERLTRLLIEWMPAGQNKPACH